MKISKKLILATALFGVVGLSNAATVYLTGSTAARSSIQLALQASGTGNKVLFASPPTFTSYQNNNYMTFNGTASTAMGGGPLSVKCHWSGAAAGIHDAASGLSQNFLTDAASDGANHGATSPTAGQLTSQQVDLAMGDSNQDSSQFNTQNGFPKINANKEVCIICFKFVRNPGVWTGSNITGPLFQQSEGFFCPRAVFDGDASHTNDFVYISGRDSGSGTRLNTFAITGYGPDVTLANQIQVDPATGLIVAQGEVGFSSGGNLANTMGANTVGKDDAVAGTTGQGYSFIGYMSVNDAATAIGLGAVELTYNGIAFSRAAVIEGQYDFWGNEYIFQRNGAGTTAQNAYTVLGPNGGIDTQIGTGNNVIRLGDMHCTRNSPFSVPSHN